MDFLKKCKGFLLLRCSTRILVIYPISKSRFSFYRFHNLDKGHKPTDLKNDLNGGLYF